MQLLKERSSSVTSHYVSATTQKVRCCNVTLKQTWLRFFRALCSLIKVHLKICNTNIYHKQRFGFEVFCQLFYKRCGLRANWQRYCSEIFHPGSWCQNMHASKHSEHYVNATLCCRNTLEHVHWQKDFLCSQHRPHPALTHCVYLTIFCFVVVVIGTPDNYLKGLGRIVAFAEVTSAIVQQILITHEEDNRCWIIITVMK